MAAWMSRSVRHMLTRACESLFRDGFHIYDRLVQVSAVGRIAIIKHRDPLSSQSILDTLNAAHLGRWTRFDAENG